MTSLHAVALILHLMAAMVWVGGMFFAHFMARPAGEAVLNSPERIQMMAAIFQRFFRWVWGAIMILPATGLWLIFQQFGGWGGASWPHHAMTALGCIMIGLYAYMYFGPYNEFKRMIKECLFPEAGIYMRSIRKIVTINLTLGLSVATLAALGRYY
ncbi:CopD family protein [Magnetofaba australis]|uniref:Putative integral membrane protein n=1 Tax=Magnetofaba australis IT-1 TaxID=1434232 RepID=A0A1Y2K5Z7_9PROT|nr:CopD family protein [Magnetofaba australis]OSM05101.1 putative integral membrane protein [Magnetofaba australis IT-1]